MSDARRGRVVTWLLTIARNAAVGGLSSWARRASTAASNPLGGTR